MAVLTKTTTIGRVLLTRAAFVRRSEGSCGLDQLVDIMLFNSRETHLYMHVCMYMCVLFFENLNYFTYFCISFDRVREFFKNHHKRNSMRWKHVHKGIFNVQCINESNLYELLLKRDIKFASKSG